MWNDEVSFLDLTLVSLFVLALWVMDKVVSRGSAPAADGPPDPSSEPPTGRKFVWRLKTNGSDAKIEIWRAQDLTSKKP